MGAPYGRAGQGFALTALNLDHLVKPAHEADFRAAYPAPFKAVVEGAGSSEASKVDRAGDATRLAITEKMDEDLALYWQFSEKLHDIIRVY